VTTGRGDAGTLPPLPGAGNGCQGNVRATRILGVVAAAAFFDLDRTVIAKASIAAFGRPLHRAGFISAPTAMRAAWGQLVFRFFGADEARMAKAREVALRLAAGWERDRLRAFVRENLIDVIEPIVYTEALDLMADHRRDGHRVYLVSAAPEEIVEPLGHYLGVDGSIATRAMIDEDGRYTGDVAFYNEGANKAAAMAELAEAEGIDLGASYAYSDSITDVPMLEAVGFPAAVNPDRDLRRTAVQRGWPIVVFDRPVRLRDRVSLPPTGPVLLVGGGVLAATATGVVILLGRRRTSR
jgi:HAD superfamily hydrolase (TIGR01490 family)